MNLRIFLTFASLILPAFAVDTVQFALPEQAQYLMSLSSSQESRMGQRKTTRNVKLTARVEVSKSQTGHRITITYLTHYENVSGIPPGGDMRGLTVVYEVDSTGKVTNVEGLDEVVKRTTAAMGLPPAVAAKAIVAQKKALGEQCELLATSLFGKPTRPGMTWKELQIAQGMGYMPKPVTRDMKSLGPMTCGLGECFAIEGTYQYNSADEVARTLEAVFEASGKEPVLSTQVNSSWDSARFRMLVHPETGILAGYQESVAGSTILQNGTQTVKEDRTRKTEFSLRDENLQQRPFKATVVVP